MILMTIHRHQMPTRNNLSVVVLFFTIPSKPFLSSGDEKQSQQSISHSLTLKVSIGGDGEYAVGFCYNPNQTGDLEGTSFFLCSVYTISMLPMTSLSLIFGISFDNLTFVFNRLSRPLTMRHKPGRLANQQIKIQTLNYQKRYHTVTVIRGRTNSSWTAYHIRLNHPRDRHDERLQN